MWLDGYGVQSASSLGIILVDNTSEKGLASNRLYYPQAGLIAVLPMSKNSSEVIMALIQLVICSREYLLVSIICIKCLNILENTECTLKDYLY